MRLVSFKTTVSHTFYVSSSLAAPSTMAMPRRWQVGCGWFEIIVQNANVTEIGLMGSIKVQVAAGCWGLSRRGKIWVN